MAIVTNKKKVFAQLYDYSRVENYYKKRGNFIFGWTELIKAEVLKNEVILEIKAEVFPDRTFFNGEEYEFIKKSLPLTPRVIK